MSRMLDVAGIIVARISADELILCKTSEDRGDSNEIADERIRQDHPASEFDL